MRSMATLVKIGAWVAILVPDGHFRGRQALEIGFDDRFFQAQLEMLIEPVVHGQPARQPGLAWQPGST